MSKIITVGFGIVGLLAIGSGVFALGQLGQGGGFGESVLAKVTVGSDIVAVSKSLAEEKLSRSDEWKAREFFTFDGVAKLEFDQNLVSESSTVIRFADKSFFCTFPNVQKQKVVYVFVDQGKVLDSGVLFE